LAGIAASAQSLAAEPQIEAVRTTWGVPYQVQIEEVDGKAVVSGKLKASMANPGPHLNGRMWAAIVDDSSHVLAVHYGEPRRMGPAKYTRRARFEIEIDHLPEDAAGVRVGYR
jgi:hypothetical protein